MLRGSIGALGKGLSVSRLCICAMAIFCASLAQSATASAETPEPGWRVVGESLPTNLAPESQNDQIGLLVYNIGGASGDAKLTVELPPGLTLDGEIEGQYGGRVERACSGVTVLRCDLGVIQPTAKPFGVLIPISVSSTASGTASVRVSVTGSGAPEQANTTIPITFSTNSQPPGFGVYDDWFSNENGTVDTQAGSHPYEFTVVYSTHVEVGVREAFEELPAGGEPRDAEFILPPGLVGNAQAVPRCTRAAFDNEECPPSTWIGEDVTSPGWFIPGFEFAVYNLVPPPNVAAQFAFTYAGTIQVFIEARVRSGGDYGITERVNNIPQEHVVTNTTTIWGIPAQHNESGYPPAPFLSLPTSCNGQPEFGLVALNTWEHPETSYATKDTMHLSDGDPTGFTGCERLAHFDPTVSIAPDTSFADTPAGLSATVKLPQGLNPEGLATSGLKETTITLPEGVVINPGQATGLAACQPWQEDIGGEGEEYDGPPSCPAASKIGTDEITTPLLAKKLQGNVYVLQSNPPELQILLVASGEGVNLKLIGTVHLNEQTGRLTTTFKGTPQDPGTPDAPLTEFVVSFSGGAQAALVTPETCGTYNSYADFTPWASPFVPDAMLENSFQITAGPGGGECRNPLPFSPSMTAGATTDQAGGYTDFSMLLSRGDGQQHIEKLQFKTPEGLLGMIAKVPLCQEPQAAAGTCSSASQIGHTVAEAGPGPYPFVLPEPGAPPAPIYLTGPYEGAPFGLSIAVPIVAGPFNLGTEVVRAKIEVDPHTSQLTISTTAFPKTVKGIPTDIREIDAVIDRPEFMFNPTSCNPMSFSGTAYSFEGATAPVSSHFQMGSCRSLAFKPNFSVSTSGKTSRVNGASLTAKIVYPTGNLGANQASSQSNIASVKVDLPKQLPSRLTTLQKACTAKVFEANPANCPAASIVGHAKAITPVLPVPIEGPTYFVSHAGEEFPSLIAVLQGYGVTVDLVGSTFINNKTNITSSTFKNVPDVPIASFELGLPQGKYSALAANGNLCKTKLVMPTAFTGQDGAVIHQSTPISVTGCAKTKKAKAKIKGKHAKGNKNRK